MKKSGLKLFLFAFFSGIIIPFNSESKAEPFNVPICAEGTIPGEAEFCAITPTVFKLDLYRAELCINDPMPIGKSNPSYDSCITLFDGEGTPSTEDIGTRKTAELPIKGADEITPGTYNYLSLVFSSHIRSSGTHTYNGLTYRTSGVETELENGEISNVTTTPGAPVETDLYVRTGVNYGPNGWRGDENSDNRDCNNAGGTETRCEFLFYYANDTSKIYSVTAILGIVDNKGDFTEQNTTNSNTLFYRTKLRSPLVLTANSSGYLDIGIKANMTVEATFPKPGVLGLYAQPMTFDLEFVNTGIFE